jgi:mono/diheme cytochrome c family protein
MQGIATGVIRQDLARPGSERPVEPTQQADCADLLSSAVNSRAVAVGVSYRSQLGCKKIARGAAVAMRFCARMWGVVVLGVLAFGFTTIAGRANAASTASDYTAAQAVRGAQTYDRSCAACHGNNLEGKAGPPLTGKAFQETLQYAKMTTSQLYAFISQSMPQNAPGSLSGEQYIEVLSFLLSKSGYPVGSIPLSKPRLSEVELLPFPGAEGSVAARP